MAELFFNKLNDPLSINRGSPAPAAQKFGENDVGTMEGILTAGRSRLANLQTQETRFSTEKTNLTSQLANFTSEQLAYNRQKEEFGAKQREEEARSNYDNIKKVFDDEISSPQYKEKQRINKEIAEYQVFAPTEVTAPMLGVLFAAIGATGMLLGGNSKNNAKAALSAMNGMAEGFGKGREQYDKERKAAFDTNVKLLQTKLSAIKDGLEDARREAVLNKQAADQKVRETLAANEAQFLQENTNKRGLESTIALVNGQLQNINQATNLLSSKIVQLTGQLDSKETQIVMRKIDAARRESEARIRAEERQKELQQKQKKLTPVGMQGDNIVMADELGNITLVPTGEGFVPKAGIQPKAVPGAAAAAKEAAKTSGVTGIVKDALGKDIPGLEAETLLNTARTIQTAKELQSEVRNNPDFVGRQGQLGNFISRYVDAAINGKPTPQDDPNLNQASLRWAKKYAVYLLEFERTLAGGQKGFTVFLQKRFNELLSQNQFNAEGMIGVLQDQMDEAARLASYKTNYATPENLRKISERAKEIQMGFGAQPTVAAQPSPAQPSTGPYTDPDKERRYQDWKARQPK